MSETVFRFRLGELSLVRLVCAKCSSVAEVPLDRLSVVGTHGLSCPGCNAPLKAPGAGGQPDPLGQLARHIQAVQALAGIVEVEFVLPHKL